MDTYIIDNGTNPHSWIGTKATNLFKLSNLDFNIPKFICISSEWMNSALSENKINLDKKLSKIDFNDENSIVNVSRAIRYEVEHMKIPNNFENELLAYIQDKFNERNIFSIRSSSMIEDGNLHTFAGQFDTYLNVGKEDLLSFILKCFSSLYSSNVLKYIHFNQIDMKDLKMGVIIQEMIVPETSGVIFSSNPQGLLNEAVIINGAGVGNEVVEDRIPVTTYYYNKTDKNYYYETNENSPILSNHIIEELMDITDRIQGVFGEYIDIEYAIKKEYIYILQARPITTIQEEQLVILDNSNIVESYPNITLPLTYSFIKEAYTGVFKNIAYIILKNKKFLEDNDELFKEMLGSVNGRVYYKISNWYTLIKALPFSKKTIPIWQDMMGVKEKKVSDSDIKISGFQKVRTYINTFYAFLRTPKKMKNLEHEFNRIHQYFYHTYNENLKNEELYQIYKELRVKVLNNWGITLLNDGYAFVFTGLLKGTLKKVGLQNYEYITNEYISGILNIESMKPIKELIRISHLFLIENKIDELKQLKDDEDVNQYLKSDGILQRELVNYIKVFGDRALEELKLESKTFRSSPILLINKIIEYTSDPLKLEHILLSLNEKNSNLIDKRKFGFLKDKKIQFLSKRAMLGIRNREISRLNRSRIYGMIRSIFLSIGSNLKAEDLIDEVEDIFYLKTEEIFSFIENKELNLKRLIQNRKEEYKTYKELPIYSRLIFVEKEWNKTHRNINSVCFNENIEKIIGTPCSNGKVTGEVVVIHDPKDVVDIKNKILVTKMTDPGWVFLLTVSKGIIAERGSLLSHTAIISRELKIPSIVGVPNITKILKTGDMVMMDGNSGIIEKVSSMED